MDRAPEGLRSSLRGIWGEHGAWAVVLPSYAAGLIIGRPPSVAALLLLPSVVLLTGAKGLAQRARRSGRGWPALIVFGALAGLSALPTALRAPRPFAAVAALAGPFLALYLWRADSPRWTRSLAVEVYGAALLGSAGALAILGSRPGAALDGGLAWATLASLFLPGVVRARLPKDPRVPLRLLCTGFVLAGLGIQAGLVAAGVMAAWGLAAGLSLLGDLAGAWAIPGWSTRRLGITLTVKTSAAALVLALAWRTVA